MYAMHYYFTVFCTMANLQIHVSMELTDKIIYKYTRHEGKKHRLLPLSK